MNGKYGFGGDIELPEMDTSKPRLALDQRALKDAVEAGTTLGFVSREPAAAKRKPRPKRRIRFRSQGRSASLTSFGHSAPNKMSPSGKGWTFSCRTGDAKGVPAAQTTFCRNPGRPCLGPSEHQARHQPSSCASCFQEHIRPSQERDAVPRSKSLG